MKIYCITHKPIDGINLLNLIPFGVFEINSEEAPEGWDSFIISEA